ncbi:hypothetical protein WR25_02476 [Diploscapter pachys]|uniref:Uncharacterized protein n=1 Tax=Diploscapter pachys TaxID=2018661 RepID=A0A2A2KPQ8_9BILA|nr:hypothetical protein WR25_02476 [Diploscapter pachys]
MVLFAAADEVTVEDVEEDVELRLDPSREDGRAQGATITILTSECNKCRVKKTNEDANANANASGNANSGGRNNNRSK